MAKVAVEHQFTGLTTPVASYDSTKTNLGLRCVQRDLGNNPGDKFAGPMPIGIARPQEQSQAIPAMVSYAIDISTTKQWVFYADHAAVAATRRLGMYEYDKTTGVYAWKGYLTFTFPTATNFQIRGMRMTRNLYTTGTVAVSGTAVTGTGTAWNTARTAVGARIGFGSTNPNNITTWYQITALGSDLGATIGVSAGTIAAGTAYVIEELRCVLATTNATTTNGGLYVVKGLNADIFIGTGTAIPAATTIDNIRAVYHLKDAATVTNITAAGVELETTSSDTSHFVYVLDGASTNARIFKYNIRAALTLTAGADTTSFQFATGTLVVTGNISQHNNGRIATLNHGPGSGVESLYFVTASRVYRCALSIITTGSTTFSSDNMTEVPPGSSNTFVVAGTIITVEYVSTIDRLIVFTTSPRSYLTQYNAVGTAFDRVIFGDIRQLDNGAADSGTTPATQTASAGLTGWAAAGFLHLVRTAVASAPSSSHNQMFCVPIAADWDFVGSTSDRVITPSLSLPGATKLYRVLLNELEIVGSDSLGNKPEPVRIKYRTSGISDNTGAWIAVPKDGDLSGVGAVAAIQFAIEFRIAGITCIPGRVMGLAVLYETSDSLPPELQWNLGDSTNADGTVGFTQISAFGVLPTLTITYYRADTNVAVLVQASSGTTNGAFEYWTGSAWAAGLDTNTIGKRRRFRPTAGLPSGVDVYAKIVAS